MLAERRLGGQIEVEIGRLEHLGRNFDLGGGILRKSLDESYSIRENVGA